MNSSIEIGTDLNVGVYVREEGMRLHFSKPRSTKVHILLSRDDESAAERITYVRVKRVRSFEYKGFKCVFELGEAAHYDNWSLEWGNGAVEIVDGSSHKKFGVRVERGTIRCVDARGEVRIQATLHEPKEVPGIERVIGMISDNDASDLRLVSPSFWSNVGSLLRGPGGFQVAVANERFFGSALNLAFFVSVYEMANGFSPQESAAIG